MIEVAKIHRSVHDNQKFWNREKEWKVAWIERLTQVKLKERKKERKKNKILKEWPEERKKERKKKERKKESRREVNKMWSTKETKEWKVTNK